MCGRPDERSEVLSATPRGQSVVFGGSERAVESV
jgi:hypothetical protein